MLRKAFETAAFHTAEFDATFQQVTAQKMQEIICKGGHKEKHDLRPFNISKALGLQNKNTF